MKKLSATLLFAAALSPLAVHAADTNWYALVAVGQSTYDVDKSEFDDAAAAADVIVSSTKLDDNDTGYKIQAGYKFSDNFAVEGGYVDLGRLTLNGVLEPQGPIDTGSFGAEVKGYGFNIDAVGVLPFGAGFSAFAKVGAILARTEYDIAVSASGLGTSVSYEDDDSDWNVKPSAGVGLSLDLSEVLSVRLEYQRFFDLEVEGEGTDADLASLGLVARF